MNTPVINSCGAVFTKFLGPTNNRGARIKVWMPDFPDRRGVIVPYGHEFDASGAHHTAFLAFCEEHNLHGKYVQGSTDEGYVFVFIDNAFGVREA